MKCLYCHKNLTGRQTKYCSQRCKRHYEYENNTEKILKEGKNYRERNKDKIRVRRKKYRERNKDKIRESKKEEYEKHKEKYKKRSKKRYWDKRNEILDNERKKYQENPEPKKKRSRQYASLNKNKRREYYNENKDEYNEKRRNYEKSRNAFDEEYRVRESVRKYFNTTFKRYTHSKKLKTLREYGIDMDAIVEHLKPFPKGRENYHIDHKYPLSKFKFLNPDGSINYENIKKAWNPNNLQWLTAEENMKKKDKIISPIKISTKSQ